MASPKKLPSVKKLERHVFVCTNERPEGHPRGCCHAKGAEVILKSLKEKAAAAGLQNQIRVQKSGCLDVCEAGPALVVYPEGVWYGQLAPVGTPELEAQLLSIVESHWVQGQPVEELKIPGK
jgi:(2Fe-2S) ferredoxin